MRPTESWAHTSVTNEMIRITRELGFTTIDSQGNPHNYSPPAPPVRGRQIAAVLGHATLKQMQTYMKQANQFLLAQHGERKRDESACTSKR
jgi:hypothetical protein